MSSSGMVGGFTLRASYKRRFQKLT